MIIFVQLFMKIVQRAGWLFSDDGGKVTDSVGMVETEIPQTIGDILYKK